MGRAVTFRWNAPSNCSFSGYTFRVQTDSNLDDLNGNVIDSGEGNTSRTETINGHDNRDLWWGVRAANASNGADWAVRRFRIDPGGNPGGDCNNPGADRVALFVDGGHGGQCVVKGIGDYPNPGAMGLPNDSASSIKVGSNVRAVLCEHDNFEGRCDRYDSDQGGLAANDSASSLRVERRPSPPATPTLQFPDNGAVIPEGERITLRWSATGDTYAGDVAGHPTGPLVLGPQGDAFKDIGAPGGGYLYTWRIKAMNGGGESPYLSATFTVKLAAPSTARAEATSCTRINLTWVDNSGSEDGYKIYRDGTLVGQVGANTTAFTHTGLSGNTGYAYAVRAFRADFLSDPATTATTTTPACDTTPPSASWLSPSPGQRLTQPGIRLEADASDTGGSGVERVEFSAKWGGAWHGLATVHGAAPPYRFEWNLCDPLVPDGEVELGLQAYDNAGNEFVYSRQSPNITVTKRVNCDPNARPTVRFEAPADGARVSGAAVPIRIDAADSYDTPQELQVELRVDTGPYVEVPFASGTGRYTATWDTTRLTDGAHTLTARATDSGGLEHSSSLTVTTDNARCPAPALLAPTAGATLPSRTVTFRWSAVTGCTFDGYTLRVLDAGGTPITVEPVPVGTQHTMTITGRDDTDLSWDVQAAGAPNGADRSPERAFRIEPPRCRAAPSGRYCAEYYPNHNLGGDPAFVRDEPAPIDHDWGNGGPGGGVGVDHFSARWQGRFRFETDTYTFRARADDGVRVRVDDALVIDAWQLQEVADHTADIELDAGEHLVTVEYYEWEGGAVVGVGWELTDTTSPTAELTLFEREPDAHGNNATRTLVYNPGGARTGEFIVRVAADDPESGIAAVSFPNVFGTDGGTDTEAPYEHTYRWPAGASVAGGFAATVRNGAGLEARPTFALKPDTAVPTVSIVAPRAGATVREGQVVTVRANDAATGTAGSGVAKVQVRACLGVTCSFARGAAIGTDDTTAPYQVAWTGQPGDGTYTFVARATDRVGNVAISARVTVTVANGPARAVETADAETPLEPDSPASERVGRGEEIAEPTPTAESAPSEEPRRRR